MPLPVSLARAHASNGGAAAWTAAARCAPPWVLLLVVGGVLLGGLAGALRAAPGLRLEPLECPADKEICVQADRSGGIDLKTGVARLEGNVRGILRSQELSFAGERLMAFREGGKEWVRLVLEQDVRLVQANREVAGDHGVLEREEIRLNGHVSIVDDNLRIDGHDAVIRREPARTTVAGQPESPVEAHLNRALLATGAHGHPPAAKGGPLGVEATALPPPPEGPHAGVLTGGVPVTTTLNAQSLVLEGEPQRIVLTGNVRIVQSDDSLRLEAQRVTLMMGADDTVESFRAEGNVVMRQPDRRISADYAQSRNQLQTILLVGNARMQEAGQFELASERMEVHAEAGRGVVQSQDRRKPITLSMDMAGGEQPFGLTGASMLALSERGVSPRVLEKLAPLIGRSYPSRADFRKAVTPLLSRREGERYLDTILAAAPLGGR